jgi:hypothetical protein
LTLHIFFYTVSTPYTYPTSDLTILSDHCEPKVSETIVNSSGRTFLVLINTGSPSPCPASILSFITATPIACSKTTNKYPSKLTNLVIPPYSAE